jgi:hypothetical protein
LSKAENEDCQQKQLVQSQHPSTWAAAFTQSLADCACATKCSAKEDSGRKNQYINSHFPSCRESLKISYQKKKLEQLMILFSWFPFDVPMHLLSLIQ